MTAANEPLIPTTTWKVGCMEMTCKSSGCCNLSNAATRFTTCIGVVVLGPIVACFAVLFIACTPWVWPFICVWLYPLMPDDILRIFVTIACAAITLLYLVLALEDGLSPLRLCVLGLQTSLQIGSIGWLSFVIDRCWDSENLSFHVTILVIVCIKTFVECLFYAL